MSNHLVIPVKILGQKIAKNTDVMYYFFYVFFYNHTLAIVKHVKRLLSKIRYVLRENCGVVKTLQSTAVIKIVCINKTKS